MHYVKNTRTTRATCAEIAASSETAVTLALRYGVNEGTVYKWKGLDSFHDASHTPQRLQTTLTPSQEQFVVELRKTLLLPVGDLLAVKRRFLCLQAKHSGLDLCLRRHGVGNLNALKPKEPTQPHKALKKGNEPGSLTSMSNNRPRWRKKPAGTILLLPLTAPRAGCLFRSRVTRRPPPEDRSSTPCTRLARSRCGNSD